MIHERKIKEDQLQSVEWNWEKVRKMRWDGLSREVQSLLTLLRSLSISQDISKGLDKSGEGDSMDKKELMLYELN